MAEAIHDFENYQKLQAAHKVEEERKAEEREEQHRQQEKYYAQSIDERVEIQVENFRNRTRLLEHREATQDEENVHREKWRQIEQQNEADFFDRQKVQKTA